MTQAGNPESSAAPNGEESAAAARASATRVRRVVALLALLGSAFLLYASAQLDVGTSARPGPGLMPLLAAAGLGLAALLALVERVGPAAEVEDVPDRSGARRQAMVLGGMAAYIVLIPVLGFLLASALAMSVISWVISTRRKALRAAVIGVALAIVVDWTFRFLLNVNLPSGLWDIGTI